MTVSAQTPISRSTGNGVTTVFPYTFKIISDGDIEVSVDDVVKTLNVDYTVSGAGLDAGGDVTMTTAPAVGTTVVRRRDMAIVRSTDYQDQGTLPAATLDLDIDSTVLMMQQLDERLVRTFSLPASSAADGTMPTPAAGYVLGWDALGKNLTNIPASVGTSLIDLAASSGSSLVGFIQSGAGAVATTVQAKLRESVSVKDFGADASYSDEVNASAFQRALDYANSIGGATVTVPAENFTLNASIRIYANTTLEGMGWGATQLIFTHAGDGINSTWPINSSTAANINVKNMSIVNTNVANVGGGFVDVCGTYVNVENCYFNGWKFGVIFDQSELAIIDRNNFVGMTTAQIWLVNGPDHTVGALKGFTNRIVVSNNQLNGGAATTLILDDGGGNHLISGNNFNAGAAQLIASGASCLTILNNEFEGCSGYPIHFRETTSGGVRVGGIQTFSINSNGISANNAVGSCVYIDEAYCGDITSNFFYYALSSALEFNYGPNYRISGISVSGNIVGNMGPARTATPMVLAGQLDVWKRQGNFRQGMQSYCTTAFGIGNAQITPASMVGIYDGALLRIVNADGTNPETCTAHIELAAPGTFNVTLTAAKSENFLIFVEDGDYAGGYLPIVSGSGPAGGVTYTSRYGSFTKVGNRCFFQTNATWTATTGGAAGQLVVTLPLKAKKDSSAVTVIPCVLTGPGAVGVGAVFLSPVNGSLAAGLLAVNQATGGFSPVSVPGNGSLYVSGSYEL